MAPKPHITRIQRTFARNRQESKFLQLPSEIRNKIYSFAIPDRIHILIEQDAWQNDGYFDYITSSLELINSILLQVCVPMAEFAWIYVGYSVLPCSKSSCGHVSPAPVRALMRTCRGILSDLSQFFFSFTFTGYLRSMPRACELACQIPMLGTSVKHIVIKHYLQVLRRGKQVRRLMAVVRSFPNLVSLQVCETRGRFQNPDEFLSAWDSYHEIVTIRKIVSSSQNLTKVYCREEFEKEPLLSFTSYSALLFAGASERPTSPWGTEMDLQGQYEESLERLQLTGFARLNLQDERTSGRI